MDVDISPLDIRQQQFRVRFRGFDIREVEDFLDQLTEAFSGLTAKMEQMRKDVQRLERDNKAYQEREETFKRALVSSQEVIEQMKENARKSAELIMSNAEVKAEKILNRAHARLAQLHEDIAALKRQRIQLETQIHSIVEAHSKLLDMEQTDLGATEEEESKHAIKQSEYTHQVHTGIGNSACTGNQYWNSSGYLE